MWLRRFLRFACFVLLLMPCALPLVMSSGSFVHEVLLKTREMFHPSVRGTITLSQVREDSREETFEFVVQYTYEVDGQTYQGDRYRHSTWTSDDSGEVEALVARFPEGSPVEVFYRPGEPSDSLLEPGLHGDDLMELLLLTACVLTLLVGIYVAGREWWMAGAPVPAFVRNGRTHVTLSGKSPAVVGLTGAVSTALLSIFLMSLSQEPHVSLRRAVVAWLLSAAMGVCTGMLQRMRWNAGDDDLIIEEQDRILSLPAGLGRSKRLEIPWNKVESLAVEVRAIRGGQEQLGESDLRWKAKLGGAYFQPTLRFTDDSGEPRDEILVRWHDQGQAERFVHWLKARMGSTPSPKEVSPSSALPYREK
jgi:hypothetical protein